MSIRGLYDSEIGDRLAKKSLRRSIDETKARIIKSTHRCACGGVLNVAPKIRNNVAVCDACAEKIAPLHGGREVINTCKKCGGLFPRRQLFVRARELYCKECAKTVEALSNSIPEKYECSRCHKKMSRPNLVQRNKKFVCKDCLKDI